MGVIVILFNLILGLPTITSARIYKGQLQGATGEEFQLAWETFPHVGLSKVSNRD